MSTLATMVRSVPEQDGPPRKRWTRTECELLEKSGIWDGRRFELVDGEVYDKHGSTRAHTIALTLVRSWLARRFGDLRIDTRACIDVAPEDNPTSEPEPDITVLTKSSFEFLVNPAPVDIR